MATKMRFSMRLAESAPLLPSSAPSARDRSHSWRMIARNGMANTPLATSIDQMPLWTIQLTRVR
ncbi:hypothetical protein D9M71_806190 [compost metagenome]